MHEYMYTHIMYTCTYMYTHIMYTCIPIWCIHVYIHTNIMYTCIHTDIHAPLLPKKKTESKITKKNLRAQ